ncbi:hypothetical protein U9M48_026800 [Paspalum notatum var. saurae]|uniref:Uncharacterized protein n=1 Tax=Paspalum notatum var. saurae TaxID=547442 RepID=A0AAQ3TW02_PASNO
MAAQIPRPRPEAAADPAPTVPNPKPCRRSTSVVAWPKDLLTDAAQRGREKGGPGGSVDPEHAATQEQGQRQPRRPSSSRPFCSEGPRVSVVITGCRTWE